MSVPAVAARPNPLRALTHRAYAIVWAGALVSNIGTWMETIAVGVHVTLTTGKAGWTGTVAALSFVPAVLLGPLAGALADRFERRRYLATVTIVQALLAGMLTLLAGTGHLSLAAVALLMTLTGCAATLLGPAFSALLVNLVPTEALTSALTLNSAQYNLARITGPMIAAVILATGGLVWAFGLNALSFLAVLAAVMVALAPGARSEQAPEPIWEGIRAGLRTGRDDKGIRGGLVLTFVTAMFVAPFIGLVPVMAIKIFGGGAHETSLLVTSQGVGALLSAVVSTSYADAFGRRRLVQTSAWAIGPVAALYWLAPTYALALPLMALLGALYLGVATGSSTVCLARAPRNAQARISSFVSLTLGAGYATGLVVQGWLGDRFGQRLVCVTACAIYVGLLLTQRALWPTFFTAMDEPSTPEPVLTPPITPGRDATG